MTQGTINNIDFNIYYRFLKFAGDKLTKESLKELAEDFFAANMHKDISHYLVNIFAQIACTPSAFNDTLEDQYNLKEQGGYPVDFREIPDVKGYHQIFTLWGYDLVGEMIGYFRSHGKPAFLSFRMNDVHGNPEKTTWIRSSMYYKAKEKGWSFGNKYGGRGMCLDFALKEVQDHFLGYLSEQLERYDTDGVELDFLRDMVNTDYLGHPDCYPALTGFMRRVRQTVALWEEKRKHPIAVWTRHGGSMAHNKVLGYDILTWAKEKLIDEMLKDFKNKAYKLAILIKICAKESYSTLGRYLAKYWNNGEWDYDIFKE
ncbi:MAG: hypothetical protein MJ078_05695, partial [Clostridia bacterium]|nr:hypothetical protein [Clostridia bacterium]